MKQSVYDEITNKIVLAIESGAGEFEMPWISQGGLPVRAAVGQPYKGINVIALWAEAQLKGYTSNLWGGFGYWKSKGGKIKKGEKSTSIIHFSVKEKINKKTGETETIPLTKRLRVFNLEQVENIEIEEEPVLVGPVITRDGDRTLEFVERAGAVVKVQGDRAFYTPSDDTITMPLRHLFFDRPEASADVSFASTILHEAVHWAGHESRLDRQLHLIDDVSRAKEELIAEIGSSFLCNDMGFVYSGVKDHASYVASWLRVLKNDTRFIFEAAKHATDAVEYLHKLAIAKSECSIVNEVP